MKVLALLFVLALSGSALACGGDKSADVKKPSEPTEATVSTSSDVQSLETENTEG